MKKRLLGSLFSGLMLCFAAQSAVWADPEVITGTALQWELADNTLTISKGDSTENEITAIPDCSGDNPRPWDDESSKVKELKLIIKDGVTEIGNSAFFNYSNLKTATIADTVTSIGPRAFNLCANLETVDKIPTGVKEISDSAFSGCTNLKLTSEALPEGLETIGETAFQNCQELTFTTIPSTVKQVGKHAFEGCTKLAKGAVFCPENVAVENLKAADIAKYHVYTVVGKTDDGKLLAKITETTEGTKDEKQEINCDDMGSGYAVIALSTDAATTATLAHDALNTNEATTTVTCDETKPVAYSTCPQCPLLFVDEDNFSKTEKDALTASGVSTYTVDTDGSKVTYYVFSSEDELPTCPGEQHKLTEVAATTATCTKPALAAHYKCACGRLYLKNDATVEDLDLINLAQVALEAKDTYIDNEETYYIVGENDLVTAEVNTDDGHTLKYYDQIDATCDKDGMKAYAECAECGKLFLLKASKDGWKLVNEEVSKDDLIIPATGHSYGEWTTTEAPTTTSEGEKTRKCATCGASETSALSKLAEESTSEVVSLTPTAYGYAVDTGDFISGEMFAYAYGLCACGVAFVSLRKKKSKV